MKKQVKKPCAGCVYFNACGDSSRTEPCAGRMTKTEQKKQQNEKETKRGSKNV